MSTTKKLFIYFIYGIAASAFFLYYLFPSDAVKKYLAFQLNKVEPDFSLTIDHIKPVFVPGIRFYGVSLYRLNVSLIDAEHLTIAFGLQSLFKPKVAFSFRSNAYAGMIDGRAYITKKSPDRQIDIETNLSGIQIKDIPALQKLIETYRPLTEGKIILVFGCPGERDRAKRPVMGKIATDLTDYAVATTDDPHNEDPAQILDEIGIENKILDRQEAIAKALKLAKKGDTVLIAGRGHEKDPFDDRDVVRELLDSKV